MLIAVSVVSAHLQETHERWKLEAVPWPEQARPTAAGTAPMFPGAARRRIAALDWPKEDFTLLDGDARNLGPTFADASKFGGFFFVLDLATGRRVWKCDWGGYLATPSGFCFSDTLMYVADLEGSNIFEVDMLEQPGRLLRRISHSALNDVHYVVRTRRGLLVASTGTDMVVELDLQGHPLYEWWAGDHGFTSTPAGVERLPQRRAEHRDRFYHTRYQTTHLNAARYRDADETHLLVLLWHQGMLIEIDTRRQPDRQKPRIVLDGLCHPHSLRPLPEGGWMIANSQGAELVLLDRDLQVTCRVPSISDWIQDAVPVGQDRWLVADVNNRRLLVHDDLGRPITTYALHHDWRVYALDILPAHLTPAFVSAPE